MARQRVYESMAWKRTRRRVLVRDGGRCQLGLEGCLGRASAVDHVTELFEGGAAFDMGNLVAACKPCNSKKHARVIARRASTRVRSW